MFFNFMIPLMIGPGRGLPALNAMSYWVSSGGLILNASWLFNTAPTRGGSTRQSDPRYSPGANVDF
jgi:heme/copper-type cytochrome/quinol oxidase subunit 1